MYVGLVLLTNAYMYIRTDMYECEYLCVCRISLAVHINQIWRKRDFKLF